jgi:hypothetical protein
MFDNKVFHYCDDDTIQTLYVSRIKIIRSVNPYSTNILQIYSKNKTKQYETERMEAMETWERHSGLGDYLQCLTMCGSVSHIFSIIELLLSQRDKE